jgi:CRP/FNR family cyclic AMP-dependent transcriptional regulator
MSSDLQVAAKSPWLAATPQPFRDRMLAAGRVHLCRNHDPIYLLGDDGGAMFCILAGFVFVEVPVSDEEVVTGDVLCAGNWMCEAAVITGQTRRIGVRAAGAVTLLRIPAREIQTMLANHPEDWRWFGVLQTMNFDRAARVAVNLMIRKSRLRVLSVLCRIVGLPGQMTAASITLDLSQGDLQPMVNLSRSVLTGILDDLEAEELIRRQYRRLTVPEPSALWRQCLAESAARRYLSHPA